MWFLFAIITIVMWGGADLFYKISSSPDDRFSHLKIVIAVGAVMGLHAVGLILFFEPDYSFFLIIKYLPVSLMYILSMAIGYFGLRYIELSVSSPVQNSSGAVACILCLIFLNQKATALQLAAVAFISVGIVLLSVFEKRKVNSISSSTTLKTDRKYTVSAVAIIFPILYCVIDGLGTFLDAFYLEGELLSENEANISYELTFLIVGILALLYLIFIKKEKFTFKKQRSNYIAAALETAGQFFYIRAMSRNAVITAPLIACYSIVSVLLSRIFLKEKLSKGQYITIGVIMAAIAVLGIE